MKTLLVVLFLLILVICTGRLLGFFPAMTEDEKREFENDIKRKNKKL